MSKYLERLIEIKFWLNHYPSKFLQSLTTSLAVLVMLLSSDYNNFSAIFIIFLVFSVFYGRRAFLFKLRAQYKDFIKLLQIDTFSVLNAGKIFSKWSSLITKSSFLIIPWIIEKWMNAKIFYAALSTIVYKINYKIINTYEITCA